MKPAYSKEIREKAIEMRVKERRSLKEIAKILNISSSTTCIWLKAYPLTIEEIRKKIRSSKGTNGLYKYHGEESRLHIIARDMKLSNEKKALIAESAILLRLTIHGFETFKSMTTERFDWLVRVPETGSFKKIQVKWARQHKRGKGLPDFKLTTFNGRTTRRYRDNDFDFIVAYDLFTDTAYVYSKYEVKHKKRTKSISSDAAEGWNKLRV